MVIGSLLLIAAACTAEHQQTIAASNDFKEGAVFKKSVSGHLGDEHGDESKLFQQTVQGSETLSDPKCRALVAKSELEAAILSSPTLGASIDEEGDTQVSLNYDLINIAKIGTNREAASVLCKISTLTESARALQKLSARSLTKQGMSVRINFIERKKDRINKIRAELNEAVVSGEIKGKSRDRVVKVISRLLERTKGLRTKALQQETIGLDGLRSYTQLEQEFREAITEQHFLKTKADFSKNVRLTLSGGYRFEDEDDQSTSDEDSETEFFGRASLSVKLGVLNPVWKDMKYEQLQAEIDQLYQPKTGPLWRIKETYRKNQVVVSVLEDKQRELGNKIASAKRKKAALATDDLVEDILLELEIMNLQSEVAEVRTNIQTLVQVQHMLRS